MVGGEGGCNAKVRGPGGWKGGREGKGTGRERVEAMRGEEEREGGGGEAIRTVEDQARF